MADSFGRPGVLVHVGKILLRCLALFLFGASCAIAQPYCKKFGGTTYTQCYPAPLSYGSTHPGSGVSTGMVFPTRLSAANWVAAQLRAHGLANNTIWKHCQYGARYPGNNAPCGINLGVGSGCPPTRIDDGGSAWNSSVVGWGFGNPYGYYPEGVYVTCQQNNPNITSFPHCPRGWSSYIEYPNGSEPVRYCGYKPSFTGIYINHGTAGSVDGPSTSDRSSDCNSCGKNPVNLVTGAKYDAVVDYQNRTPYPIRLVRYYSNAAEGWHFNYDMRILGYSHDAAMKTAQVVLLREDGTYIAYNSIDADPNLDGSLWTWQPTIDPNSGGRGSLSSFSISRPTGGNVQSFSHKNLRGEMEVYDAEGALISLSNQVGHKLVFSYDSKKRLSVITDDSGRWLAFEYPTPTTQSNEWLNPDPQGDPILQTYEQWSEEKYSRWHMWKLPSRVYDNESQIIYEYIVANASPADSRVLMILKEVTQQDGSKTQYLYGEPGSNGFSNYLTGIIGADGERFASYTYASTGTNRRSVAQSTHGNGLREITYSINTSQVKDAYGNAFSYVKDYGAQYVSGKPSGFNTPCPPEVCSGSGSQAKAITWDVYGNPLTITDYNNRVRTYTWDGPRALPLSITEATGTTLARTTTLTWHTTKRIPLTRVEPIRVDGVDGTRTTTWTYDTNGNVLTETVSNSLNGQARSRSWTYNSMGQVETSTDARGKTTSYAYDTQANLLTAVNALNQTTTWSNYTYRGLPQKMVNANGLETLITYDARDRVIQIKRGSQANHYETWNVSWLAINKIDRITRPDGVSYKMLYDSAHDLIEVQERSAGDALLGKRVYTLDLMGRLTKEEAFDGAGNKIASAGQTYNTLSRLASQTGAQNQSTTFTYDADGNLTGVADPLAHSNASTIDALGRTVSMVDALNKSSTLTYDVQDNLTAAVDARGVATGYAYNAFNDLLAIYSPDRGTFTMSVDAHGNTLQTTDPRGVVGTVSYDDLDRPTSISWDSSSVSPGAGFDGAARSVSYTWDICTNGIGKLCSKTDWTGTTGYSYDLWGRLVGEAFTPAGESFTLATGYSFDAYGRQDAFVYPSGKALTYTHSDDGRPSGMRWAGTDLISNLRYLSMNGPVAGWTWAAPTLPAGKSVVAYTYDLDGRITHISDIEETDLVHDLDDRLTATSHLTDPDLDQTYTYDAKHRLTQSDNAQWAGPMDYAYDFGDNRTSKNWNGDSWQNTYSSTSNRLLTTTAYTGGVAGEALSMTMDAMGNITHDGLRSYTYDATGRMVGASAGSSGATYQVNSSGLRVRKTVSGVGATDELVSYDTGRRRMGVYQPDGLGSFTVKEELVYLPGSWRLVSTVRGQGVGNGAPDGTAYPILTDHLGSPRVVLDPNNGDRRWTWEPKEAFGFQAPNENPDSVSAGAFVFDGRFPGQFLDAETGLYHNGYRDYDAKNGRYIESDPLGLAAGWNTYGYVAANPTMSVDLLGLSQDDYENKLPNMLQQHVDEMVNMGIRRHGKGTYAAYANNAQSIKSILGSQPWLVCSGQADYVIRRMKDNEHKLDDRWEFHRINNGAHHWVIAVSSNPSDPIVRIDPWYAEVTPGKKGYGEWMPYWGEDNRPHFTKDTISDEAAERTRQSWIDRN